VSFHFYDLNNVTERIAAVIRTVPLLIALLVAGPAFAQSQPDALTLELRALATDFAKIINKQGGGAVAIGEFSASSDVKGSVGPRIQMVLADELKKLGLTVATDNFRFEIKGDYQPHTDKETGILGVKLIGRLIDRDTGEPIAEKPTGRFVFGSETVPGMLGLTVAMKPNADPHSLSETFKQSSKQARPAVAGTRLSTSPTSPYAIEILVKSGGAHVPRPAEPDDKGRLFVPLAPHDVYAIRLINDSKHDAAVKLEIDGVNSLAFDQDHSSFWIVGPGKSVIVKGWVIDPRTAKEFKVVGTFEETAAAKLNLKPSSTIGLITASFSAAWSSDAGRPSDEPDLQGRGTGFGREIEFATQKVKTTIGQPRDIISVRYER
jgi:hypothetical protein